MRVNRRDVARGSTSVECRAKIEPQGNVFVHEHWAALIAHDDANPFQCSSTGSRGRPMAGRRDRIIPARTAAVIGKYRDSALRWTWECGSLHPKPKTSCRAPSREHSAQALRTPSLAGSVAATHTILPAGDTPGAKIESVSTQEHLGQVEDAPFDPTSMAAGTMRAKDSMSASCINMTDQKITAAGCSRMQTVGDRIVTSCVQVI